MMGGVTGIWMTNQASEIKTPFDWSKVRGLFCSILTTSGWQGTAVVSEEEGKEGRRGQG